MADFQEYYASLSEATVLYGCLLYTSIRIKNACRLLLETKLSITDIAFECGFNDSNYFGDAFRHMKGVSPNKYRKNKELVGLPAFYFCFPV